MDKNESEQIRKQRSLFTVFPPYVWFSFAYLVTINMLMFYATRLILPYLPAHSLSTPLDELIPVSYPWVTVYFLSFASWGITIVWMLLDSKRKAYRMCGTYSIVTIVCVTCFLAYPVTIERPEIVGSGVFPFLMRFLYRVDSPTNLFPSLHVVISYLCWRGTMDCERIPKWYQWFNLFFLILVCFSILFVKQHFAADIASGLVVAEAAMQISRAARLERIGFAIDRRVTERRKRKRNLSGADE